MFKIELSDHPIEGDLRIVVRDSSKNLVSNALLSLDGIVKKTDINGTATFYVRRGNYSMTVEKPGFLSVKEQIEVKGRIYLLEKVPLYLYIIAVFILAVVYYELKKNPKLWKKVTI